MIAALIAALSLFDQGELGHASERIPELKSVVRGSGRDDDQLGFENFSASILPLRGEAAIGRFTKDHHPKPVARHIADRLFVDGIGGSNFVIPRRNGVPKGMRWQLGNHVFEPVRSIREVLRESPRSRIPSGSLSEVLPSVMEDKFPGLTPSAVVKLEIPGENVRPQLPLSGVLSNFVGVSGLLERSAALRKIQHKADHADDADEGRPERPSCSLTSGVCGLPLGAKIGISMILAGLAWSLQERGFGRLGLFGDAPRKRLRGLGEVLGSFCLFGLCALAWGWGSTY